MNSQPTRLLIVDDEISVHKLLSTFFRQKNTTIESCIQSTNVLEVIAEFQPDLAIVDLMMPEVDGISLIRQIRASEEDGYLPIIVLTAKTGVNDLVEALAAGADDYLRKPFEFEELDARVNTMLRIKQLQDGMLRKTRELEEANQQIQGLNSELQNANKQLQKKLYEFHNVFEVSYSVLGQLEFEYLVRQALIHILGIFSTRSALLLLRSEHNPNIYEVVDACGFDQTHIDGFQVRYDGDLCRYIEKKRAAVLLEDLPAELSEFASELALREIKVLSPLFRQKQIDGFICLGESFSEESYGAGRMEIVAILTNILAVAIHNSQMFERIRELSYTDGMTGLHNYRFFRLRMKEEIARANRDESRLALLIMDVDNFKNYNDTLGHPAGDDVLRRVSDILKRSVRDNDIVARYGGEEFAVILPGTDSIGALSLAERIRREVEETTFFRQEIQPQGKLTVSIGIGLYPDNAPDEDRLIINADKALYHAKKTGKNRVVQAKENPGGI